MDFEKKYPITQQPGEFVLVQWTRGYKQVEVYYNNELVGTVEGAVKLKKGARITHAVLGNIDLKLSDNPIMLNVIVDGYHSPVNTSHPEKELKRTAVFFWMVFAFAIIGSIIEGAQISISFTIGQIVLSINLIIVAVYGVSAYNIGQGRPWAYYMGFSLFCLTTLLTLLTIRFSGFIMIIAFLFRIGFLVVFIINMKHAINAGKHQRYGTLKKRNTEDLLDTKL